MSAVSYFMLVTAIWLLPILAIICSVFAYIKKDTIIWLRFIASVLWLATAYEYYQLSAVYGSVLYYALMFVWAAIGLIMIFMPSGSQEEVIDKSDRDRSLDERIARNQARQERMNKIRSLRGKSSTSSSDDSARLI